LRAQELSGSSDQKEMDVFEQERKTKGFATNGENREHVQRIAKDFVKERLMYVAAVRKVRRLLLQETSLSCSKVPIRP
jgi:hypothetical protein